MFQGNFKSILELSEQNANIILCCGSLPINIKIAQLSTFADGTTKQQGYQVAEVNKLISTMLTASPKAKPKTAVR